MYPKDYLSLSLILQTLQQLKDVYGDSVDKIVQGNTSNIVFLKSTDDTMIETLSKMSGVRHRTYTDSKTITKDMQALLKMTQNEGKTSYTMTTKEEPVISYNDMAFISERNSIVFRAGDSPIWNRNETILPMSWRLFSKTITQPGKNYSLQTIPTLSTAMDFDVRKNQPNFMQMLENRMEQAYIAEEAAKKYQEAYGYDDYQMSQIDPDNLSDDIMDLIYTTRHPDEVKEAIQNGANRETDQVDDENLVEMFDYIFGTQSKKKKPVKSDLISEFELVSENTEQIKANAEEAANVKDDAQKRYAGRMLSRDDIVSRLGYNHAFDEMIIRIYKKLRDKMESDSSYFKVEDRTYTKKYKKRKGDNLEEVEMTVCEHNLCGLDGKVYIRDERGEDHIKLINEAAKSENARVFAENDMSASDAEAIGSCVVTNDFLRYLVSFNGAWPFADGDFDRMMKSEISGDES